jgi:hypothetical protein
MRRRVVVTGMAGLTSLGDDWAKYDGLNTNLGGPLRDCKRSGH